MTYGMLRGRPPGGPFAAAAIAASIAVPLGLALAMVLAGAVLGHGPGGPWLTAEPYRVNPGGTIEVRGDNLGADEEVTISLVVGGQATDLGVGTTDGEGHLVVFVAVPADVPAAGYGLMGRSSSGSIARGTLTVAGPPIVDQGGADPYERGPIGTLPPAAGTPAAAPPDAAPPAPVTAPGTQSALVADLLPLVAGLALAALVVLGTLARRRTASNRP